jgi:hypothetical protein
MPTLYVGVLNYNTQSKQSDGLNKRKTVISDGLAELDKFLKSTLSFKDNSRVITGIFAAPEYAFARPASSGDHTGTDIRHLGEGTKVEVEKWIKEVSAKFPKILMFPGTVAWKKAMARDKNMYVQRKQALGSPLTASQLNTKFTGKTQTRAQKAQADLQTNAQIMFANDITWSVASHQYEGMGKAGGVQYYFTDVDTGLAVNGNPGKFWTDNESLANRKRTAPSTQDKLNKLGTATEMARNTCYVYLAGKKLLKYNKQNDYHEVLDTGATVYVPGKRTPFVTVEGLTYGIEVCLDHVAETQKKLVTAGQLSAAPDVLVVLSAQVEFDPAFMVDPTRYVIHSCSDAANNRVGVGSAVTNQSDNRVASKTNIDIYKLDIP